MKKCLKFNHNSNFSDIMFKLQKRAYRNTQVHFYEGSHSTGQSGIKACIFGGNSGIGVQIGRHLLYGGTPVNSVHRHAMEAEMPWGEIRLMKQSNPYNAGNEFVFNFETANWDLYHSKIYGDIGKRFYTYCPDLTNEWEIENAIKDCDVIINCIGQNPVLRNMEDFEEANVIIPRKIAKICAKLYNDPVKRLIHFSANGVDPQSISKSLKTKWIGEQEVLNYFPEATIIRPTEILHSKFFNNFLG